MFAVIETGGKQYMVKKGDILEVEKIEGKDGSKVEFDKVLLIDDKIGTPTLDGASVSGKILKRIKEKKIVIFKMKAKKRYSKSQGHRQNLSKIEITDIKA